MSRQKEFAVSAAHGSGAAFDRTRRHLQNALGLHSGEGKSMRQRKPQQVKGPIIGLTTGLAILISSPGAFAQAAEQTEQAAKPAVPAAADSPVPAPAS